MQNAKKYDDRITIGLVPGPDDLNQLNELGYKTLIDLREENEKFGGFIEKRARELGLSYISIPVARNAISLNDVKHFYQEVYRKGSAPLYIFSRFGKKAVVFLLLFETVAKRQALVHLYRKADKLGFKLQGDISFQSFILSLINSAEFESIVKEIRETRPDILKEQFIEKNSTESAWKDEEAAFVTITEALLETMNQWIETRDARILRENLSRTIGELEERRGK
jgi:protein tyrosine phosphatase (PTP) superfamily phosphohydrolase (DUF442 family)